MDTIATFSPTAETSTDGVPLVAGPVHVLHLLDRDTYDWQEVGLMYQIRQRDGSETQAFADELDFSSPMTHEEFYAEQCYIAEVRTDEAGIQRIDVWGPFDTVEASEDFAEAPGGPASTSSLWWTVSIRPPEERGKT